MGSWVEIIGNRYGIRDLIHEMFPTQTKIELFARQKTEGWDVWGNEVESDITLITELIGEVK